MKKHKHHDKTNVRGLNFRPRHYLNKQQGFGLLEISLVILIGVFFMFFAIRHYNKLREENRITQLVEKAQDLLRAGDRYYSTYCAQNVTGLLKQDPTRPDPYAKVYDINRAMQMLDNGKNLTVADLEKADKYGNTFLNTNIDYSFPFGSGFMIKIIPTPMQGKNRCSSISADTDEKANCLGQTETWQVVVSACLDSKTMSATSAKAMFNATNIVEDGSDCQGENELQWISTPRVNKVKQFDQGQTVINALQEQNNTMYRYGPWMQQGKHSDKLSKGLNYLCQS